MNTPPAPTGFASQNSRLGEKSGSARHRQGFRYATRRLRRACGRLGYDLRRRVSIGRTVTPCDCSGNLLTADAATQRYVFDGTNMVLAFDGSGNLTDRFLWGPMVDQVLADEHFSPSGSDQIPATAGNTLWALGDNQDSVRDVVTDSGALEEHIAYSPFGEQVTALTTTGSVVANFTFGYTGTYTDTVTADQLHGVRWYDPASQRWLSPDPSGLGPDANPYGYCGDSPTNAADPTGQGGQSLTAAEQAAVASVMGAAFPPRFANPLAPPTPDGAMNAAAQEGQTIRALQQSLFLVVTDLLRRYADAQKQGARACTTGEDETTGANIATIESRLRVAFELSRLLQLRYNSALMRGIHAAQQAEAATAPWYKYPSSEPKEGFYSSVVAPLLQGGADAANGATNLVVHTANAANWLANGVVDTINALWQMSILSGASGGNILPPEPFGYFRVRDWSRNRFARESEWVHNTTVLAWEFAWGVVTGQAVAELTTARGAASAGECAAPGGTGYRVMSSEEYAGASVGKWADSRLVAGDAAESGSKWLWTTEDAAKSWQTFVQQNGEEGLITTVDTAKPLSAYPNSPHPPQGTAVQVPIPDLGPAKLP